MLPRAGVACAHLDNRSDAQAATPTGLPDCRVRVEWRWTSLKGIIDFSKWVGQLRLRSRRSHRVVELRASIDAIGNFHEWEDEMVSRNMTALLSMLAMAGWQNRDRLGELLGTVTGQRAGGPSPGADPTVRASASDAGGLGGLLGGLLGGGGGNQGLSGGLGELLNSFTGSGQGDVADSWVQPGPNKKIDEPQLANALGSDTIDQLAK